MRWALVLCLVGCYDPKPFPGSPCSDSDPCPSTQTCVDNFCQERFELGGPDAPNPVDTGFDVTPTPTDRDGDGFDDAVDNCPDLPNDQGNEDGDALGDDCDPCPIDGNNTDTDTDGVGDACDPRPNQPGDTIAAFSGFHAGVPAGWQLIGMAVQMGDDLQMTTVAGNHTALVPPVSIANATVTASIVVDSEPPDNGCGGPCGAASTLAMAYNPSQDQGVFCELFTLVAGQTNNRSLDVYDSAPDIVRSDKPFNWQNGVAYKLSVRRDGNAYSCSAADAGGPQVTNGQTASNPGDRAAVSLYGANAHIQYLLVVNSP